MRRLRWLKNKLWLFWSRFDVYFEKTGEWVLIPTLVLYVLYLSKREFDNGVIFVELTFRFLTFNMIFQVRTIK